MTYDQRATLSDRAVQAYTAGASIREIAAAEGRAYGTIHRYLTAAGVKLRPKGGHRGKS